MELYLSDFTAFLEIWIGTILLMLYRSIPLLENNDNNHKVNVFVHSTDQLSRMYRDFIQKYQGYFPDTPWRGPEIVNLIRHSSLSLNRIYRRYRYISLTVIFYGLFILFYIGIEKTIPSIYPLLVMTDILIVVYLLLLSFINSNYLVNLTLVLLIIFIIAPLVFLFSHNTSFLMFLNNISRSVVTIITLFTCCFFVFVVFYLRFSTDRLQVYFMNKQIRKCDSDIQALLRMLLDNSELKVHGLSRRSRKIIEEYCRDHSSDTQIDKDVIIRNLILERLCVFMRSLGN